MPTPRHMPACRGHQKSWRSRQASWSGAGGWGVRGCVGWVVGGSGRAKGLQTVVTGGVTHSGACDFWPHLSSISCTVGLITKPRPGSIPTRTPATTRRSGTSAKGTGGLPAGGLGGWEGAGMTEIMQSTNLAAGRAQGHSGHRQVNLLMAAAFCVPQLSGTKPSRSSRATHTPAMQAAGVQGTAAAQQQGSRPPT